MNNTEHFTGDTIPLPGTHNISILSDKSYSGYAPVTERFASAFGRKLAAKTKHRSVSAPQFRLTVKKPNFIFQKKKLENKRNTTTYVRKEFFRRLLFLGLGIVPVLLFLDKKGIARYISGAGFLFSLYQLICIISMSQLIIDDFFPPKTPIETRSKPFARFMYLFAGIFFFSALIFEVVEIRTIDNTINGMKLFWLSGLVGIVIAIILTVILKITNPSVYFESSRRYTVHFGLFAGCFLFSTAAAGFINHFFADKEITCKTYTVIRKSTGGKSNNEFWIFINTAPGKKERLDVSKQLYNSIADNGQIELCTRKGKLGYDVVDEILPANW